MVANAHANGSGRILIAVVNTGATAMPVPSLRVRALVRRSGTGPACEGESIQPNNLPSEVVPQASPIAPGAATGGVIEIFARLERSLIDHALKGDVGLKEAVERLERCLILAALEKSSGRKADAARLLGIPARVLDYKMASLGIKKPQP